MSTLAERTSLPSVDVVQIVPLAALVLIVGAFAAVEPRMLSGDNLVNITQQASYLAIFAVAQMLVLVTRGFDLALGGTVSATSVATALVLTSVPGGGASATLCGLLVGLGFGVGVGLFNGLVIAGLRVNPFIATLGSYNICLGIATTISAGRPVAGLPNEFTALLYSGTVAGIPVPLLLAAVIIAGIWALLRFSVFGRSLYLIGTNERASVVAGIPTRRVLVIAYVLCAVLSAIGAMMLTARTGSGEPNLGGMLTLQAIAAAIIGGVGMSGGRGGVGSAIFGAVFVTVLSNGMNLIQVHGYYQMIVLGATLIASIVFDRFRK
jgi:ribose transport system permease protein